MARIMVNASTGAMKSLLGKLATLRGEEFAKLKNLRKDVKFISDELGSMTDALERLADVDELDPQTKRWRNTLREISYDIEDIIDDFMQIIGEKDHNSWFGRKTIRRLKNLRFRHRLARKIEEIKKLVCETSDRRKRYDLDNIVPTSKNDVAIDPRVLTPHENAANLIGVEGPKHELVDRLKDEEKQLKVVSIVGFGGLGKTTLANVIYGGLKGEFKNCAFVLVSQKPDMPKLLPGLLSQLGVIPSSHNSGLNVLLDQLRLHLQKGRIFGSEEACPRQLRHVSVEILKICGGLPLAIINISSMLASECSNQNERWEHVRCSLGSVTNLTLERMRGFLSQKLGPVKEISNHEGIVVVNCSHYCTR